MNSETKSIEALRLVSDWAKWLITIETTAIAIIGATLNFGSAPVPLLPKVLVSATIIFFLVSIAAAATLLLTLPEIAQLLNDETNIWLTSDSIAGHIFHLDTQRLAILESLFFGMGLVCFSAAIISFIWSSP